MSRDRLVQLLRFGLVGGGVTLLCYLIFLAGIAAGCHYLLASAIAWVVGLMVGFFAHRRVTFSADGRAHVAETIRYLGTYILQFMLGTATLAIMIDGIGLAPWIAYPVNVVLTASFSYLMMSLIVFRPMRAR